MSPFHWQGKCLVAAFDVTEVALLKQVVGEIRLVLRTHVSGTTSAGPAGIDPVAQRLLPDGHRSDPELAQDYRGLTESGLRSEKLADADLVLGSIAADGGRVKLDQDAAQAWLRTLNDLRLAIGVRLDVQETDDPVVRAEQTGDPRWSAYSWLTAVQGLLVDVLADSGAGDA